jgi:uncharacterized membrane-anchored protein YhcB (DUF1043 family)
MGFEVWIAIVLVASGLSGWIGFALARKEAPKQAELDAMVAELDEARQQAESVQANVSEHFEQSALLFGKLASDYREFLDHFESSAQNLGLSEARARELIEQGFQPLLTHHEADEAVVAETEDTSAVELPEETENTVAGRAEEQPLELAEELEEKPQAKTAEVGEVTVEMPENDTERAPATEQSVGETDPEQPASPERQRA